VGFGGFFVSDRWTGVLGGAMLLFGNPIGESYDVHTVVVPLPILCSAKKASYGVPLVSK
jgi:hypothetical protein